MSYPTFSLGGICGPKFQYLCLYVTGYLQIGTHLNIHSFNSKFARVSDISQRAFSSLSLKKFGCK